MRRICVLALCTVLALLPQLSAQEAKKEPKAGEEREFEIFKGVKMKFCWVPSGKATLGSLLGEKGRFDIEREHDYETKGFWLGKYEVMQAEWKGVMGNEPSHFKGAQLPVERVSWDDCQKFIEKCKVTGLKVKLPHEDEWEYACRGGKGNKQPFYWGDTLNGDKANCDGTRPYGTEVKGPSLRKTTEVGSYEKLAPHPWGLCDMHGNVWEWCDNLFSKESGARVLRGGSWYFDSTSCRAAARISHSPDIGIFSYGFRVCLVLD